MSTKLVICLAAVLCLSACPAEEDNNGADAGTDMAAANSNPAECPNSPPPTAEPCESEGLTCTYSLMCPCGPNEDFVWTCTDGQLMQPSLSCSTGSAADCPMTMPDMSTADMTAADMSAPDMAEDMAPDMEPDLPPSTRLEAHGCRYEMADDLTGNATVVITDLLAWDLGHNDFCIIVDQGTIVSWNGAFNLHPLDGGISPTEDATSPITVAGEGAANGDTVEVTLDAEGDFPYFCGVHDTVMQGVIYVDAP